MSKHRLPIYQSLCLDHFETPRHVRDHIRASELPSVHQNTKTHNTDRHQTLSVRTLRVRELCRHDLELFSVNNQSRNLDAHICSYIFYEDLYRSNRITTYVVPFVIGMLLARDSIVGIQYLVQSRYRQVSLLVYVMHHSVTNSLATLLARLILMCITERAQRYLSDNRSDKT